MCETEREKPCEWDCVHNRYCHLVRWRGIHKNDELRQIDHNCVKRRNRTLFYMFTLFLSRYYSHVHTFLWNIYMKTKQKHCTHATNNVLFFVILKKLILQQRKKRTIFIVSPSSFICMNLIGFLVFGWTKFVQRMKKQKHTHKEDDFIFIFRFRFVSTILLFISSSLILFAGILISIFNLKVFQ